MASCLLPLVRVYALDGRLVRKKNVNGLPAVNDAWWFDVMHDARARTPHDTHIPEKSMHAGYRFDRQGLVIEAACQCGRHKTFDATQFAGTVSPDVNVMYLIRENMGCKNKDKQGNYCRAYWVR